MTYQSSSFNINIIRAAVEEYINRHGQHGGLRVVQTHISADDYTAQGHAVSALDGVVIEVERIARRRLQEGQKRHSRLQELAERCDRGEITEEEYLTEAYCFI